ncbi:sodium:proton antiporter [Desulforhopalus sp. IMCC35007]|uniref:cation:proton antiporter n=1 Tax=Desulforhopalus sp. IMCC35007 TaxID=2569543 RepID=UPI0010AEA1DD|nr:cation:proton antiporter [Desulforhopalus sp. IMCC35007]TKB11327.1 sodium:proton antiporter [Desulforhopalus sp. IMCC35007]
MYNELAILALFVLFYSMVAGRLERTFVSGTIVFVATGLLMGPLGLGWLYGDVSSSNFRVFADLTLALVLFIDAANTDFSILRSQFRIPVRMLLLGLPGVIFLGTLFASIIFDVLSIFEAAILGTMLAATDAALGKAIISNKTVPIRIREGLNIESGLNDGLCVPILFVFIALANGSGAAGGSAISALKLVFRELGFGLLVGLSLSSLAIWGVKWCLIRGWVNKVWLQITVVGLAIACFSVAQSVHGSGYIASFSGGLYFGYKAKEATRKMIFAAEGIGETLALVTWMLFGAIVVSHCIPYFTWSMILYAVLSLTVIRMVPIFLSLIGTGESIRSKLFLGWFGPRGLASIVFSVIVLNRGVPGGRSIAMIVTLTVFLSLMLHGISANPLARWLGKRKGSKVKEVSE